MTFRWICEGQFPPARRWNCVTAAGRRRTDFSIFARDPSDGLGSSSFQRKRGTRLEIRLNGSRWKIDRVYYVPFVESHSRKLRVFEKRMVNDSRSLQNYSWNLRCRVYVLEFICWVWENWNGENWSGVIGADAIKVPMRLPLIYGS